MKILKAKEKGFKATTVDAENLLVTCHTTSVHESLEKDCRFQFTWVFDFNDCPMDLILRAAAEKIVIANRIPFKTDKKPTAAKWDNRTFLAKDLIAVPADKVSKAKKTVAGFTDAQLAELGLTRIKDKKKTKK